MAEDAADLLLEIGTEDLPACCQPRLASELASSLLSGLARAGLAPAEARCYTTPRRLAVLLRSLPAVRPGREKVRYGPPVDGNAAAGSPARIGFARSCGCAPDRLQTEHDGKSRRWVHRVRSPDVPVRGLLPEIISRAVADMPRPREMVWGAGDHAFVRPVRWIVSLFGGEVLPVSLFGRDAGRHTRGHRVHAPDAIALRQPADYGPRLLENGFVRPDFAERRSHIEARIGEQEKSCGGRALVDEDLLDEVTAMVEWPAALAGRFDEKFLALPRELLVLVMRKQQRFFPVCGDGGTLKPMFIGIADTGSADTARIARGYERVLVPRLEDAAFFWQRDQRGRLADRIPALAGLVFHHRLGSMRDRSERIASLAAGLASGYGLDESVLRRAAELCKCDLLTGIVGEFPELQGTAGGYYAARDGESADVATAIGQHYRPVRADGDLPDDPYAAVLAVADKLDLVCAIFSAGDGPTAEADPYAVRRAALGCLRILAETEPAAGERSVDLSELVRLALRRLNDETEKTRQAVIHFFHERWRAWHLKRGTEGRVFDAVAANGLERLPEFQRRLQAVGHFLSMPQAAALAGIHKRVRNILRQAGRPVDDAIDRRLFVAPAERELADRCERLCEVFPRLEKEGDYRGMLCQLAESHPVVESFFERVRVMDEDKELRRNRLSLLARLSHTLNRVADLSRLSDG